MMRPAASSRMKSVSGSTVIRTIFETFAPAIHRETPAHGLRFQERLKTSPEFPSPDRARLDFDAHGASAAGPDEIDLGSRWRAPVAQLTAAVRDVDPRSQLMQDQSLQQPAAFVRCQRAPQSSGDPADHTRIGEIKLGMANLLDLGALLPCG
jgi:hypothetical protein